MRKALILTVLYLFGSEAVAQKNFRHAPTVALDDLQDNEMALNLNVQNAARDAIRLSNNDYRVKVGRWDAVEDDEMFTFTRPAGSPPPYRPTSRGGFDDAQDNEMALDLRLPKEPTYRIRFAEDDELFTQGDMGRMGGFLGNGGSGISVGGGSAPGGVAWGGAAQYAHNIGRNTQVIGGASFGHAPGSQVSIQPHVGVKFSFDDETNDELFAHAEDDELFTQGDMGRMGGFLGSGKSGISVGGGSAPGGVAWGGAGQYAHNIGKNTQVIGGASFGHAPGSQVSIQPHVGVKFNFDDAEEN